MKKTLWIALALALGMTTACKKDEPKPAEKPAEPVKEAKKEKEPPKRRPGGDLAPEIPTTRLGEIPVAEDLEEEAARTVSMDNLEAELDRLEGEIIEEL